jgi:hypothetical protein
MVTGVWHPRSLAVWDRVTCAVDGTGAGLRAAEEVTALMPAEAELTVLTLADPSSYVCARELADELASNGTTLACVLNRRVGHVASLALEPLVLALLHKTECPLLVLRERHPVRRHDGAIVVGFDGSGGGFGALTIARELAERRSAELVVVEDAEPSAGMLVDASVGAQLLVIGSSGRSKVTGGVGEQAVRRASCPVLLARGAPLGVQ